VVAVLTDIGFTDNLFLSGLAPVPHLLRTKSENGDRCSERALTTETTHRMNVERTTQACPAFDHG